MDNNTPAYTINRFRSHTYNQQINVLTKALKITLDNIADCIDPTIPEPLSDAYWELAQAVFEQAFEQIEPEADKEFAAKWREAYQEIQDLKECVPAGAMREQEAV